MKPHARLRGPLTLYVRYCVAFVSAQLVLLFAATLLWERWTDDVHEDALRHELQGTHGLIAERLAGREAAERRAEVEAIQLLFAYPVQLQSLAEARALLAEPDRAALGEGRIVLSAHGTFSHQRVAGSDDVITLGSFDMPDASGSDGGAALFWLALLSTLVGVIALPLYFLIHRLWHDVRALHDTVHHLRANAFDHPVAPLRTHLLRPVAHALQDMAQQMRTLLDGQRLMGQAMAHELRTPIARLRFTASLIEDAVPTASAGPLLQEMQSDLQWLEDLTTAGVEYVRFGRMPLVERAWVDVAGMLQASAAVVGHQGNRQLTWCCVPGTGVYANAAALELAVRNLLSNAMRHARREVLVTAESRHDGFHLQVEDDGPGIPRGHRQDVFAPYFRLHDAPGGFGLGLAMVRTIAERHGGRVSIRDSLLGGACLALFLPRHEMT